METLASARLAVSYFTCILELNPHALAKRELLSPCPVPRACDVTVLVAGLGASLPRTSDSEVARQALTVCEA